MIFEYQNTESIASLVHGISVEILFETGYCVPDTETLTRLEIAEFIVDREMQMVRIPSQILEIALWDLPKNTKIYERNGVTPAPYKDRKK